MRKRLLRLLVAFIITANGYGIFATRATQAQCACACSYVCSGTCGISCSGCGLAELIETAARCCEGEKKNVQQHCPQGGGES